MSQRWSPHFCPEQMKVLCLHSLGSFVVIGVLCHPMDCSMPGFPGCPSPSPGACSNSCPLYWWCHPTISPSVVPFSSCLQSFLISESFPVSQLFASGSQSIRASASASVLPMNIQDWFSLGLTGLISLLPKGLSRVFSSTTVRRHCVNEDHQRSGFKGGGALSMRSLILCKLLWDGYQKLKWKRYAEKPRERSPRWKQKFESHQLMSDIS